ncbi:MAG: archaeosortase/exosortase family protein, partial [Planctomycetota bacterium]|nr:archaeosortase/exosortase family protein [Planctomycetota bacterium]
IFLALCVAFAMMTTHRPLWERIVIAISAIPIAFIANVVRITLTGVLYQVMGDNKLADYLFHDAAGFLMIPIAGGLLYLEYQILTRILVDADPGGTARHTILAPRTTS